MPDPMSESSMPKIYQRMKSTWYKTLFPLEFENTEANAAWIQRIANATAANRRYIYHATNRIMDASNLPRGSGPAVICASGSSLNQAMPFLKDFKGTIFCTQSQARTLVHEARPPDYIVTVDARRGPNLWDVPDPHVWDKTVFLAHPGVHPDLFRGWPATIGLYRILDPESIWYSRILPMLWPGVNARLVPYADSMAAMLAFAMGMGYNPILMAGCDYTGDRFDEWRFVPPDRDLHSDPDSNNPWTPCEHRINTRPLRTDGEWVFMSGKGRNMGKAVIASETGLGTDVVSIHSKRGVLITAYAPLFSQGPGAAIYNMSNETILDEIPHLDVERGLKGDIPPWTQEMRDDVLHRIERTLARHDTFLIPVHNGARLGVNVLICETFESLVNQVFSTWQEVAQNRMYIKSVEKQHGKTMKQIHEEKMEGYEEYVLDELSPGPEEWVHFDSDRISTPPPGEFIDKALGLWKEIGRDESKGKSWQSILTDIIERQKVNMLSQAGRLEELLRSYKEVA